MLLRPQSVRLHASPTSNVSSNGSHASGTCSSTFMLPADYQQLNVINIKNKKKNSTSISIDVQQSTIHTRRRSSTTPRIEPKKLSTPVGASLFRAVDADSKARDSMDSVETLGKSQIKTTGTPPGSPNTKRTSSKFLRCLNCESQFVVPSCRSPRSNHGDFCSGECRCSFLVDGKLATYEQTENKTTSWDNKFVLDSSGDEDDMIFD